MFDVALVGCGYMGRHHARTIAAHPGCTLAAVYDIDPARAASLAALTGAQVANEVPGSVDAVVIATPTVTHAALAEGALARGQWCLVEKPLAATEQEGQSLVGPRLVVGHVERFNPAIRAAGPLHPHFVQSHRMSPPSPRGRDVDVVLDLLIHDLDLLLMWAGPGAVDIVDASGVQGSQGWDVASVRLRTSDGVTASLTASRVARQKLRMAHLFEPGRHISLDMLNGVATVDGSSLRPESGPDALSAQWQAFADAVEGRPSAAPRGEEGARALTLAHQIRRCLEGGPECATS